MVSDKEMTTFTSEKCGLYEKLVMKECVFVFLVYMKKKNGCGFVISVITKVSVSVITQDQG